MRQRTSLGDFISALYDTIDTGNGARRDSQSQMVTACTLDLLLRQRNGRLLAALFETAGSCELN